MKRLEFYSNTANKHLIVLTLLEGEGKSLEFPSELPTVFSALSSFVTNRVKDELLKEIRFYESLTESVEEPRILLIGQIGAGKSSFFNSVNSTFRGHVILQATSGHGDTSVSKQYRTYPVYDGKGGKRLPYVLCDTMGLEDSDYDEGIRVEDIISVIKGHVPDLYEFNPKAPITRNDKRYRENPSLADKVHCVVFVVEADTISLLGKNLLSKFKIIRNELTSIGEYLLSYRDVPLSSPFFLFCLQISQLGQILGVPISSISPVKNYSTVTEVSLQVDILLLKALQQMLRAADACFDDMKLKGLAQ
uniref:Interferon-induced protein 44-like n=1 Tax=Erpetoichthys calabaricus TaxID=27687 RepID=A0A8C4SUJ3_ERPCA